MDPAWYFGAAGLSWNATLKITKVKLELLSDSDMLLVIEIFNLDSSSGDGRHWVMWFKKGKDMFYFDSYGVQPPNELLVYLKSPIFHNRRVQ